MNIKPMYDRILVKQMDHEVSIEHPVLLPGQPRKGEVIAIGCGKQRKDGSIAPMDVAVGDRVLFGQYVEENNQVDIGGAEYLMLREADILGVVWA